MVDKNVKVDSTEKQWARACGEALLKNLDFIDIIANIRTSLKEVSDKNDVNLAMLSTWFFNEMPLKVDEDDDDDE